MKNLIPEYFYFSRSERNGFLLLGLAILLLFLLPQVFSYFQTKEPVNFSAFENELDAYLNNHQAKHQTLQATYKEGRSTEVALFLFNPNTLSADSLRLLGLSPKVLSTLLRYRSKGGQFRQKEDLKKIYGLAEQDYKRLAPFIILKKKSSASPKTAVAKSAPILFPFDPNQISRDSLQLLGLSEKVANTLINFRKKGGRFRKKETFSKIFGLTEADYLRLYDYIQIPDSPEIAQFPKKTAQEVDKSNVAPLQIDINQAGAEEWQQLKGIGPVFAKRIISFRDKLGGFSQIDQIGETYGLADSTFQQIKPQLLLSPIFKPVLINSASAEELKSHPYIQWRQAQVIVNYRQQHGLFKESADLLAIGAFEAKWVERLSPYLRFEE